MPITQKCKKTWAPVFRKYLQKANHRLHVGKVKFTMGTVIPSWSSKLLDKTFVVYKVSAYVCLIPSHIVS